MYRSCLLYQNAYIRHQLKYKLYRLCFIKKVFVILANIRELDLTQVNLVRYVQTQKAIIRISANGVRASIVSRRPQRGPPPRCSPSPSQRAIWNRTLFSRAFSVVRHFGGSIQSIIKSSLGRYSYLFASTCPLLHSSKPNAFSFFHFVTHSLYL